MSEIKIGIKLQRTNRKFDSFCFAWDRIVIKTGRKRKKRKAKELKFINLNDKIFQLLSFAEISFSAFRAT